MSRVISIEQYSIDGKLIKTWPSIALAANELNLSSSNISRALDFYSLTEGGFKWKTCLIQPLPNYYKLKVEYSEEQKKEFNERIKGCMYILYGLLRNYSFITSINRDDCIQEALIYAWINYYSYKPSICNDDVDFKKWFRVVCKSGIFRYYRNYVKNWNVREYEDYKHDSIDPNTEDKDGDDILFQEFYNSIDTLSDIEKQVITYYLNGTLPSEISELLSISRMCCYKKIMVIKNKIKTAVHNKLNNLDIKRVRTPGYISGLATPIEQFDLDGNFIKWYKTINSVKEDGFSPDGVSSVITNRQKTHKGFNWKLGRPINPKMSKTESFSLLENTKCASLSLN